jgi:hypothetical protein
MKTIELETRAEKALMETLAQMSCVELKRLERACAASRRPSRIFAHVEVLGHNQTLICTVERDGELDHIRAGLRRSLTGVARHADNAIPVVIAPYFSPEAQAACETSGVGFLDLEGNAHLILGEVFIAERSVPCQPVIHAIAWSPRNRQARIVPSSVRRIVTQESRLLSRSESGRGCGREALPKSCPFKKQSVIGGSSDDQRTVPAR